MKLAALLVSLAAVATAASQAPPARRDLPEILRKVMERRAKIRLTGVRTVQVNEFGERRVVTERVVRDGVRQRIEVMGEGAMKGVVMVEDGPTRLVYLPSKNELRELPSREMEFMSRLRTVFAAARGKGSVEESDGGLVAGIPTRLLQATPPKGGASLKAWIDPEQGTLLKMQTLDRQGEQTAFFEFTRVSYETKVSPALFKIDKPGAKKVTVQDDLVAFEKEFGMKSYRLPQRPGWRLAAARKMAPQGAKVVMQTYLGPAGPVSLFQVRGRIQPERLRRAAGERARVHTWQEGDVTLVLIGDLSTEHLERLAAEVTG